MNNGKMVEYKCEECGNLLFNADVEYGVIKVKCSACGEVLEFNCDENKLEGECTWHRFKTESDFYNLVLKYNANADRVNYAEEVAPRVYALYRRLHPGTRIRLVLTESEISTYFTVHISVEVPDGPYYIPYHSQLIGLFENGNEEDIKQI